MKVISVIHMFFSLPSRREEESIQLDGLNAAQIKEIREKSEKHVFQAEVNRMMKLIINSLYKNKEVSCTLSADPTRSIGLVHIAMHHGRLWLVGDTLF